MYQDNDLVKLGIISKHVILNTDSGPMALRISFSGDTSIRFDWYEAPTCYTRTNYRLKYNSTSDGIILTENIHRDVNTFTLGNLQPDTDYFFEFITIYGEEESNPVSLSGRTSKNIIL